MRETTQKWLSLIESMRRHRTGTFETWRFAVGNDGTDEERYQKGIEVAKMLGIRIVEIRHKEIVGGVTLPASEPTWSLLDIVEQLRSCHYECEAGSLENNVAFQALEKMVRTSNG